MAIRKAQYPVLDIIINRWSPRAMSGQKISQEELYSVFEAARWAQSSYNNQPWRFIYAHRDSNNWNTFFSLLVSANQSWAKNAAVLIVVVSANNFTYNNKPSRTHSFDTGAACENLSIQATVMGLVAHGMEGFDYDRARVELKIPDDHTVEAMFALGRPGIKEDLPQELQSRENPSNRQPIDQFVFEGVMKSAK